MLSIMPSVEAVARTDAGLASEIRHAVMRLRRRLASERHPDNELSIGQMVVLGILMRHGDQAVGDAIVAAAHYLIRDMWEDAEGAFHYTSCPGSGVSPSLNAQVLEGLAYAWRGGSHVRVEFLINHLPPALRNWLRVFTLALALAMTVLMTLASFELVSFSFMFETRSGSWLRTPVAYPQMVLVGGSIVLVLQLLVELGRAIGAARGAREDA